MTQLKELDKALKYFNEHPGDTPTVYGHFNSVLEAARRYRELEPVLRELENLSSLLAEARRLKSQYENTPFDKGGPLKCDAFKAAKAQARRELTSLAEAAETHAKKTGAWHLQEFYEGAEASHCLRMI